MNYYIEKHDMQIILDALDGTSSKPFPAYNRNEYYNKDGLTVGLYRDIP